jgi:hypothetical protein
MNVASQSSRYGEVRRERAAPWPPAIGSRRAERHREELRGFPMLETFRQDPERKRLDPGESFVPVLPVRHHAWKIPDLSKQATVVFSVDFDGELHCLSGHGLKIALGDVAA